MKKILISLMSLLLTTSIVLADNKKEATEFFENYVTSANNYSPAITEMYSPDAKIIRQVVKPDGTTVDVLTDTATYIKQMKLGQATAKLRNYKNSYTNINTTEINETTYKVSSLRQPSGEAYKLKAYMVLKKQSDGNWKIVEEMMQTKVQTLLRYANK